MILFFHTIAHCIGFIEVMSASSESFNMRICSTWKLARRNSIWVFDRLLGLGGFWTSIWAAHHSRSQVMRLLPCRVGDAYWCLPQPRPMWTTNVASRSATCRINGMSIAMSSRRINFSCTVNGRSICPSPTRLYLSQLKQVFRIFVLRSRRIASREWHRIQSHAHHPAVPHRIVFPRSKSWDPFRNWNISRCDRPKLYLHLLGGYVLTGNPDVQAMFGNS